MKLEDRDFAVTASDVDGGYNLDWSGRRLQVRSDWQAATPQFEGTVDGCEISVLVERRNTGYRLSHGGAVVDVEVRSQRAAELAARMPARAISDDSHQLLSPIPGLVVSIAVRPGDEVKTGQPLAIVDAMKMENVLRAETDARVARVCTSEGEIVAVDQVILEFDPPGPR